MEEPQRIDISKNRYRLTVPQETKEAFVDALIRYNAFLKGDFRYLMAMRKEDINGKRLNKKAVAEALGLELFDLAGATFGNAHKVMWPEARKVTDMLNTVRREIVAGNPAVLSAEECRLAQDICEFYARLHVGQLTHALERLRGLHKDFWSDSRGIVSEFEKAWKQHMFRFDSPNMSLGVGSRQATHLKDMLWSMHEVIRHRLAWDAYPSGWHTVDFGTPTHWYKPVPMVYIERESP